MVNFAEKRNVEHKIALVKGVVELCGHMLTGFEHQFTTLLMMLHYCSDNDKINVNNIT